MALTPDGIAQPDFGSLCWFSFRMSTRRSWPSRFRNAPKKSRKPLRSHRKAIEGAGQSKASPWIGSYFAGTVFSNTLVTLLNRAVKRLVVLV